MANLPNNYRCKKGHRVGLAEQIVSWDEAYGKEVYRGSWAIINIWCDKCKKAVAGVTIDPIDAINLDEDTQKKIKKDIEEYEKKVN